MVIFNALLNLSELKELYSGKPVCVCPLYNGVLNTTKIFEATGNPITIPEYQELIKLNTEFSPKQAGTGDPSPENVRPISGWNSVKVTVSNESESHDYDITFPETIYGGTVDVVNGTGEKTYGSVLLGDLRFSKYVDKENTYAYMTVPPNSANAAYSNAMCSGFGRTSISTDTEGYDNGDVSNRLYIRVLKSRLTDGSVNAFVTWLKANQIQFVYQLATPEPFEISQVSIPSLKSINTFFTNGENMDIIYKETSFWG